MIIINNTKYESYFELCKAYNISYAEFIKFRTNHKNIGELELLGNFIENIGFSMKEGNYITFSADDTKEKFTMN